MQVRIGNGLATNQANKVPSECHLVTRPKLGTNSGTVFVE